MGRPNPLRWDCERRGCFNVKKRPKIEQFAECLPGAIAMGDVDGIVEIKGRVLLLEWKEALPVSTGQRILYERMTANLAVHVLVVIGDPETMATSMYAIFNAGRMTKWRSGTLDDVKGVIRRWAAFADQQPRGARTP